MIRRITRSVEHKLREKIAAESSSQHSQWSNYLGKLKVCCLILGVALFGSSLTAVFSFATGVNQDLAQAPPASITRTITYDANGVAPEFTESITDEDGRLYNLVEASRAYPAPDVEHYRTYTATVELPVAVTIENAPVSLIRPAFSESLPINEEGFRGVIHLVDIEFNPVYVSYERLVERTLIYQGMPSADISALPTAHSFLVSSDEYIGATCNKQLERLGVTTEITNRDTDGRPVEYQATVTFRGIESVLVIDHYQAVASYRGDVSAIADMVCVDLTYKLQPIEAIPVTVAPATIELEPEVVPETPKPNLAYLLLLIGSAAIIVMVMVPLLYYKRRADACLVTVEEDGHERVLLKRRLVFEQHLLKTLDLKEHEEDLADSLLQSADTTLAVFVIPENFEFNANDTDCSLLLKGRRYQRADFIDIRYRGKLVFRARPTARLDVAKALLTATTDTILVVETDPMVSFRESCQKS